MTEPRFFVTPDAIQGEQVRFSPAQSRQIARVLRLPSAAVVFVLDNAGSLYTVRLTRVHPRETLGVIVDVQPAGNEPPISITLYQALLKGDRMDWVFQKGTEIGISCFVPMVTERTVVRRTAKRARWERIVQEAAEQCRRAYIPEIKAVVPFPDALDAARGAELALIAHNGAEVPSWRDILRAWTAPPTSVALLIGPEGGFTDAEVAAALARGIQAAHLGPRTLRAETAALVAATLLLYHWGDVGGPAVAPSVSGRASEEGS